MSQNEPKSPRFYKLSISLKTLFIKMEKCFFCFALNKSYFIFGFSGSLAHFLALFLEPSYWFFFGASFLSLYSLLIN
jgi:hypothetical protein